MFFPNAGSQQVLKPAATGIVRPYTGDLAALVGTHWHLADGTTVDTYTKPNIQGRYIRASTLSTDITGTTLSQTTGAPDNPVILSGGEHSHGNETNANANTSGAGAHTHTGFVVSIPYMKVNMRGGNADSGSGNDRYSNDANGMGGATKNRTVSVPLHLNSHNHSHTMLFRNTVSPTTHSHDPSNLISDTNITQPDHVIVNHIVYIAEVLNV